MENKKERLIKLIGILFIVFVISNFIPTKYFIMSPGIAQELSPMVTVEDGYKGGTKGDFMLTAVGSKRATIWDLIYIKLKKPLGIELEAVEDQLPPGMDMNQYLEIMSQLMEESKSQAQAVAFKKANYKVEVKGEGAEIKEISDLGSAKGKLENGDVIIDIDNQPVAFATDAVKYIRSHEIGDEIKIKIKREEKVLDYTLEAIELENNPGNASIGVWITTKNLNYKFPRKVEFHTENIIGPSAGGMFTLEIYNQLSPEDITKGRRIAGTGTISLDGSIGKIDGVVQKILAAKRSNVDIFIVPVENYEAAKGIAPEITLVQVKNIDEAIAYLQEN